MRRLAGLLLLLLAADAIAEPPPRVAIIIDDLGNNLALGLQAVDLPGALTYSVLPGLAHSRTLARAAHAAGKEVMLHLPMQSADGRPLGPGALYAAMQRDRFTDVVRDSLAAVPHVAGVNNHMGSLLTRDRTAMGWLMDELACHGSSELYFVDSRTDIATVAQRVAGEAGLRHTRRDVFLDNDADPAAIRRQLDRLLAQARRRGSAVAIGHPYPETLAVLAESLAQWDHQAIELVPVSRLVDNERRDNSWRACSSRWQTAARNSRLSP